MIALSDMLFICLTVRCSIAYEGNVVFLHICNTVLAFFLVNLKLLSSIYLRHSNSLQCRGSTL
jgi:hypothetical protein